MLLWRTFREGHVGMRVQSRNVGNATFFFVNLGEKADSVGVAGMGCLARGMEIQNGYISSQILGLAECDCIGILCTKLKLKL